MHGTGCTISQAPGVVRMRVGEHNRAGMQPLEFSEPIKATVDHHIRVAIRDQERGVHRMAPSARRDLTTCAYEL
jgi:hypothetical protein